MKSSIGDFLAILRKSKGLTQQEVADRLGVSNKTVSSWETGASCPDISMLPAIAELFEVTCDELLRGERISSAEPQPRTEEKREKALGRMLAMYRNNAAATSWICGALYAVAIIATLLIGCAAFESLIGFFAGLIFIVGAVFLCVIQLRYLRFQLTQNDFASDAIDELMKSLSKKTDRDPDSGSGRLRVYLPARVCARPSGARLVGGARLWRPRRRYCDADRALGYENRARCAKIVPRDAQKVLLDAEKRRHSLYLPHPRLCNCHSRRRRILCLHSAAGGLVTVMVLGCLW